MILMGHCQLRIPYDSMTYSTKRPVFLTDGKVKDEKQKKEYKAEEVYPLASDTLF